MRLKSQEIVLKGLAFAILFIRSILDAMEKDPVLTAKRAGMGVLAVDAVAGAIDATNSLPVIGSLDIRPVFHLPILLAGATLAVAATMRQRELS